MHRSILWTGLLGGAMPALCLAATGGSPPAASPVYSDSVVVSATAIAEESERVPSTVTVITGDELEARQATGIVDLIATAPGTTAVAAGGPGQQTSLFIRGTESDHALLLWNGVELNSPFFGVVNWQLVPTDGVERIEIVRGPAGAIYGGSAVGGVVQVLTGRSQGVTLRLEGGDDGYRRAGLAAGRDLGAFRFDLFGHTRRGDGEVDNGFHESDEVVGRLGWEVNEGTTVGLLARVQDSATGIPFAGGEPDLDRRIAWKERQLALPVQTTAGDWTVAGQLSHARLDSAFRNPDDAFGFTRSDTESRADRGRVVASYHGLESLRLAAGADYERVEVTDSSAFGTNLESARQRTWAAFAEAGWQAGSVSLDLGVRRDDNDVFGSETSLEAGGVVRLGRRIRLRASWGEAFRPPTLGELYFPFSGNPELAPETSESVEVGVAVDTGPWRFDLAAFDVRLTNLIDFDFATFRNVNVGRAESRGLELAVGYRGDRLDTRANVTLLDTEDLATGLELLRRPERSANLVVTYRPAEWTLNLVGRYVGERADVDPVTFGRAESPSYERFDLAARWQASRRLAPYARLENLADERYAEALGFPAPGRTWIGGVALSF